MLHYVGVLCGDATDRALCVLAGDPDVFEVVALCYLEAAKLSAVGAPHDGLAVVRGHLLVVVRGWEAYVAA